MRLCFVIAMIVLTGCNSASEDSYGYECTVERVEGTFLAYRQNIKSSSRMVTMYRITNGTTRTFMFPAERVQCAGIQ